MVISTEMLEHAEYWEKTISNIKNICVPGGLMLLTTRSKGFGYHAYPHDYWRYEKEDMEKIFSDCEILEIEKDNQAAGIFIKARKPLGFKEKDLSKYELYSIVTGKKMHKIEDKDRKNLHFYKIILKLQINHVIYVINKTIRDFIKFLVRWDSV